MTSVNTECDPIGELVEEFANRCLRGERPAVTEYAERYPELAGRIRQVFPVMAMMEGATPSKADRPATTAEGVTSFQETRHCPPTQIGDYRIIREIGHGGMGVVYEAEQSSMGRRVALKVLAPALARSGNGLERFRREVQSAAQLHHTNIVPVHDVGNDDGVYYYAMQFIPGCALDQVIQDLRRRRDCDRQTKTPGDSAVVVEDPNVDVTPAVAAGLAQPTATAERYRSVARLGVQVARALEYAHSHGILHRDIKPANLLLDQSGRVWVTDFGLAKAAGDTLTRTGDLIGTIPYMAPERFSGNCDPRSDVFSLGLTLYELLALRRAFPETSRELLFPQMAAEEPTPLRQVDSRIPRDIETIIHRAIEKEPSRRYSTAGEMAADLERFLEDRPIGARPASPPEKAWRWCRRNPAKAAFILSLAFGLIGTSAGLVRTRDERDRAMRAEQDVRGLLAESHAQSARLAIQRGAWRTALEQLDRALAAGHNDPLGLSLLKVRARCALHDIPNAIRDLERLAGRSDLGELEGPVLLLQADIALGRSANETALALVQRALTRGLPAAEADYARGLLAVSSTEAVRHFRQAVERDPFHNRANSMLGLVLVFLGESEEARQRMTVAQRLFPEDPTFRLLMALLDARDGKRTAAFSELEKSRPQLGESRFAAARQLLDAVHQVRDLESALVGDAGHSKAAAAIRFVTLIGNMSQAVRALQADPRGCEGHLLLPLPPVLGRAAQVMPHLPKSLLLGDHARAIDELEKATAIHPDGMLLLLRGTLLANSGRLADAERVFGEAAGRPSFVPVRRAALYGALYCQWSLARTMADSKSAGTLREHSVQTARRLIALGGMSQEMLALVATVVIDAGELDLARPVIAEWERQFPNDLGATRRRMLIEFQSEAYGRAIAAADRLLLQKPNDAQARRIRAAASEHVRP